MTQLAQAPRLVIDAALTPLTGSIFQPTGFPDLGAATFQRPGDPPALLVESVQSVTNHLEAAGWGGTARAPVATLAALPWMRVTAPDGAYLTSSRTEPHRLAAAYVRDGRIEGVKGTEWLVQRLGLVKDRPLPWASIYTALFEIDPLTLLHGVFFSEKGIPGNPKVRRAVTALVEAEDIAPVVSGGLKRDDVAFTAGEGRNAEAGYGFVPFGRTEFTAREIRLRVVVDLEQIRGYGLGDERAALLENVALWQISTLLSRPLRLRTMCDLDIVATTVARPAGFTLPASDELAERIAASPVEFEHAGARTVVFGA